MDGRRKLTVLTDTAWGFGAGPDVPVKREWDRCGAAKLGLQPPFRAGTCGTGGGRAREVFTCSVGERHRVPGPQLAHGQTAPVFRRWESRSRSYAAFFRRYAVSRVSRKA